MNVTSKSTEPPGAIAGVPNVWEKSPVATTPVMFTVWSPGSPRLLRVMVCGAELVNVSVKPNESPPGEGDRNPLVSTERISSALMRGFSTLWISVMSRLAFAAHDERLHESDLVSELTGAVEIAENGDSLDGYAEHAIARSTGAAVTVLEVQPDLVVGRCRHREGPRHLGGTRRVPSLGVEDFRWSRRGDAGIERATGENPIRCYQNSGRETAWRWCRSPSPVLRQWR